MTAPAERKVPKRTIVLTGAGAGASDGIGAAASELLAGDGTRLVLVGRSPAKTKAVADRVGAEHHVVDFERLDEVRDLAATLNDTCRRIDVLANNAGGIVAGPTSTPDGFETTSQVNHLASYLLTRLRIGRTNTQAYDPAVVRRHWELSAELLGIRW